MTDECIVGCDFGSSKYTLSSTSNFKSPPKVIENELSKKSTPY